MKTVMVSGSRDWVWGSVVRKALNEEWVRGTELIHGDASGADAEADAFAREKGWAMRKFKPDYARFGKQATHIRNQAMVDQKPDIALFFVRDMSNGTMTTLEKVVKARIKFRIFYHDDYAL